MKPQAKIFVFCGYSFDKANKKIAFDYRIEFLNREPLLFTETIVLPKISENLEQKSIQKFFDPLLLILGISYYKLYCPSQIKIPFKLSCEQADFWNTVYRKGLGEFLYRNRLNPKKIAKFPCSKIITAPVQVKVFDRAILGIGGGKDSIVAAELLKNFETISFLMETQRSDAVSQKVIDEIGNPHARVWRELDSKIFEQHEGAYNGHIPVSAIFAFVGLLIAAVYESKYVVVANEHSSNFGNIKYRGETINHQWSKSVEFEMLFQEYARKFITPDIVYFSILRQFHEIKVAQMFSEHKKYFPFFTSCNKNFRISKERPSSLWCGECPKCAFVFLMLAPFLNKKEIFGIFRKNLFADESLIPLFKDLLGFGKLKPFDCVGTFEESQAALYLASKKFKNDIVVKTIISKIKNPQGLVKQVLKTVPAPTVPTPFRFLGIKNVCILGYGKEGKVTEKYLKKNYPNLKIGILDQNLNKNYLQEQFNYD